MIYLKSIKIKNLLSHKDTNIDFKENQKLLISGASGSGKSSIIESIIWNLYGKGRSENKNLIKTGEKKAEVVLTLSEVGDENHEYKITRTVGTNGRQTVVVTIDGKLLEKNGVKETQDYIEKDLLKASYVLFINSIASPQENPENFVKQSASKKKDLLLEIANVDDYDLYYNKIKDLLSEQSDAVITIQTKIDVKTSQSDETSKNIVDVKDLNKQKDSIAKEVSSNRDKISILQKEKNEVSDNITNLREKKESLKTLEEENSNLIKKIEEKKLAIEKFNVLDEEEINKKVAELRLAKEELKIIEDEIQKNYLVDLEYRSHLASKPVMYDFTSDLNNLQKQVELIYQNNDIKCPFCGQNNPRLEENINKQVAMLKEQLNDKIAKNDSQNQLALEWDLRDSSIVHPEATEGVKVRREELKGLTIALEHFEADLGLLGAKNEVVLNQTSDINFFSAKITENIDKMSKINDEIVVLEKKVDSNRLNVITGEEYSLNNKILTLENETYTIVQKIGLSESAEEQVKNLKVEIKELEKEIKKITKEVSEMTLLKEAFSPKGIKTIVIDYLVPILEEKINTVLSELSDCSIQIDTQKTSQDGEGVIEGLFINVINSEGNTLEYSNYSGGERTRIDYSISEALASLSNVKFRILDETVAGLDDQMLSSFLEILEKMSGEYKQLIAISHIPQIQELFDEKLEVTKKNGTSIIN